MNFYSFNLKKSKKLKEYFCPFTAFQLLPSPHTFVQVNYQFSFHFCCVKVLQTGANQQTIYKTVPNV